MQGLSDSFRALPHVGPLVKLETDSVEKHFCYDIQIRINTKLYIPLPDTAQY